MRQPLFTYIFILVSLVSNYAGAQALDVEAPSDSLYDLGLEDLMKVNIASREAVDQKEAPGIITVITREEIKNSGARNLIDVLSLVPGFQFATDYNGTVSLGVRGLWSIEGKVLLMIDGMDMNDLYYNSNLYSYAFPVDQISRIEVIRGPGSVIYGGAAEYAVINVMTLSGQEINGASVSLQHGTMAEGLTNNSMGFTFGKKYGTKTDDLEISLKAFGAHAGISDRDRTYPDGSAFSNKDSKQHIKNIYASAKYKGFTVRFNSEDTHVLARDAYGVPLVETSEVKFHTSVAQIDYDWKLSESFRINPTFSFKQSLPYYNEDSSLATVDGGDASNDYNLNNSFERYRFLLPASYQITDSVKLLFGGDFYHDIGRGQQPTFAKDPNNPAGLSETIDFYSNSAFAELSMKTSYGTFSSGGRYESHNYFSGNFVPRLSWTKSFDKWNYKLLYSQAYRTPSIGNVHATHTIGQTVDPEKTRVFEAEIAHNFTKSHKLTLSLFDMLTRKPIVYDPVTYGYMNAGENGSYGAELEHRISGEWGFSILGFSYYNAQHSEIAQFRVPQDSSMTAGFSDINVTWNLKTKITKSFSVQPTFNYLGTRYGYDGDVDADGALEVRKYNPVLTANLFASYEGLGFKGLDATFGVANMFNSNNAFLAPYDLGRNTLPGSTREYIIRFNYKWDF